MKDINYVYRGEGRDTQGKNVKSSNGDEYLW